MQHGFCFVQSHGYQMHRVEFAPLGFVNCRDENGSLVGSNKIFNVRFQKKFYQVAVVQRPVCFLVILEETLYSFDAFTAPILL